MISTAFKRIAAIALVACAFGANATTSIDLSNQAITSSGYDWTFNTGAGTVSGGLLNFDNFDITSVSINGNTAVWTNWLNMGTTEAWSLASTTLTAGIQHIVISGTGTGNVSGHLDFASTAAPLPSAPVPEPETYAMLLAGLGALGFVARRRKAQ
ncbi:MAG: PEP-CTERM sorting domain-containing protein [Betaproteobacteria bacterium]|nr:PEP-CTERM sorting domain-containing protein [Betaproteobacteria bacterium]